MKCFQKRRKEREEAYSNPRGFPLRSLPGGESTFCDFLEPKRSAITTRPPAQLSWRPLFYNMFVLIFDRSSVGSLLWERIGIGDSGIGDHAFVLLPREGRLEAGTLDAHG